MICGCEMSWVLITCFLLAIIAHYLYNFLFIVNATEHSALLILNDSNIQINLKTM